MVPPILVFRSPHCADSPLPPPRRQREDAEVLASASTTGVGEAGRNRSPAVRNAYEIAPRDLPPPTGRVPTAEPMCEDSSSMTIARDRADGFIGKSGIMTESVI